MQGTLRSNWPNYLIEAWGLGIFMVIAGAVTVALEYPASPLHSMLSNPLVRRLITGVLMGFTAISIIYSPWGKRSGAHLNPAMTLTFYRLGKLGVQDTVAYILAQALGGLLGVALIATILGQIFTDPPISYVVTQPGSAGFAAAFGVEFLMAMGLMTMVLWVSNHRSMRVNQLTGIFAGCLVASYITVLAPFSGMSINPARTFASALPAGIWTGWWIYVIAPTLAMMVAAEVYLRITRKHPLSLCGKLCPNRETPCLCTTCCEQGCAVNLPTA
jgi:aquaporin Z